MSAAKHTPGPWRAERGAYGDWFINAADGSVWIAKTVPMRDLVTKLAIFETEPDARLIAAAPDLLKSLRDLADAAQARENPMGDPCALLAARANLRDAAKRARAVIAKATGSES